MARVSRTETFIVPASEEDTITLVRRFLVENDVQIREDSGNEIEGRHGSQLTTRLVGGWFVNPAQLPKVVKIRCQQISTESTKIAVTIGEAMGIGPLDKRAKHRYRQAFETLLDDLRNCVLSLGDQPWSEKKPSSEAMGLFQETLSLLEEMESAPAQQEESQYRDIAAQLTLAVHKANAPFPRAHAVLAVVLSEMDEVERAADHAEIALQQDANEFRAQLVKVELALRSLETVSLGLGDFIHAKGNLDEAYFGSVGKTIGSLIASGRAALTQSSFRTEVDELTRIFRAKCAGNLEVDEYLFMARSLIAVGDLIAGILGLSGQANLYSAIVDTPVNSPKPSGRRPEITSIQQRAEGRLLLSGAT